MFGNLFNKGKKNDGEAGGFSRQLMDLLGCPCAFFPEGTNLDVITSAYNEAFARREMGGFTPMLIVADGTFFDNMEDYATTPEELNKFREEILASEPIDAHKWFVEKLAESKEEYGDYWEEIVGAFKDTDDDARNGFRGIVNYSTGKSVECILAKIPVTNPWEVFAWLPFGGWNECPRNEVIFWIAKYWYEKYGAVPGVMTCDILEFSAIPVKDKTAAFDLALEQFAFCPDIVLQGTDTIGNLAASLSKSSTWYFWWD